MYGGLPEYLLFPSGFIYAFPCSYHEIARETHARPKHKRAGIRGNPLVLCVARQSHCFTNGNDVGLRINFATADCGSVSADCRCCYAVLRSAWNSSGCHFLFVDRSQSDCRNLFWKSGAIRWLLIIAPLFCYLRLWFNMLDGLVAFAGGKASRRGEILNDLPDRVSDILIFVGVGHSGLMTR